MMARLLSAESYGSNWRSERKSERRSLPIVRLDLLNLFALSANLLSMPTCRFRPLPSMTIAIFFLAICCSQQRCQSRFGGGAFLQLTPLLLLIKGIFLNTVHRWTTDL